MAANSGVSKESALTTWLSKTDPRIFNIFAGAAAFVTYFCMYSFRKPFSAATFSGVAEWDYKGVIVVAQIIGYCISKYIGIKVVSEAPPAKRALWILLFIALAEAALLLFALIPPPYNVVCLFLNGLPLGMIWGLVFSFLEGRRTTEFLGAVLSMAYIWASGAVKSVGKMVMLSGVSEFWMPFVTGLIFVPFLLVSVYALNSLPKPTKEDEKLRTKRVPMDGASRKKFFKSYAPGLILLTVFYFFLTAYRDIRDNYSAEIWEAVGMGDQAHVFFSSELLTIFVLLALVGVMFIKDNVRALVAVHLLLVAGSAIVGLATLGFQSGIISPMAWMSLLALGLYLAYVPFGCVLFDRVIAETHFMGNAAFMIYLTDAVGYTGSVTLQIYKMLGQSDISWYNFFIGFSYFTSISCVAGYSASMIYFYTKSKNGKKASA